jgi:hypothetical protein
MKERVDSIELQMALIQQELVSMRGSTQDLPQWLKNAAISMLGAIFLQTITAVWWASEITTTQNNIKEEVYINSSFREEYPKTQQDVMVKLTEIQSENRHMKEMLNDVKEKLNFLDQNHALISSKTLNQNNK